jgi:hypothetical protein
MPELQLDLDVDEQTAALRYLAFLANERRALAHILPGALIKDKDGTSLIYTPTDRLVDELVFGKDAKSPLTRAVTVLEAVGIDPYAVEEILPAEDIAS